MVADCAGVEFRLRGRDFHPSTSKLASVVKSMRVNSCMPKLSTKFKFISSAEQANTWRSSITTSATGVSVAVGVCVKEGKSVTVFVGVGDSAGTDVAGGDEVASNNLVAVGVVSGVVGSSNELQPASMMAAARNMSKAADL